MDLADHKVVLGTAGHIDHGKTALIRALTGVETDRLAEEQARGITITLGFAPLDLDDGRRVSVVDVPGHEGLVRTMVSGATGEFRHPRQGDIDLAGRTANLEVDGFLIDAIGQVVPVHDAGKGTPCIQVRNDDAGLDFVPVLEDYTNGLAVLHEHLVHTRSGSNLSTVFLESIPDSV